MSPSANKSVCILTLCYTFFLFSWISGSCVSSGVPQSFSGIPVWGGKDLHLRGAAQFPTANTQTWEWWELDSQLGFELCPIISLTPPHPPFFFSLLKFLSPLRKILAGLHPANQWQNIWLWFCCQCDWCRAKHWAISPWQQGKQGQISSLSLPSLLIGTTLWVRIFLCLFA